MEVAKGRTENVNRGLPAGAKVESIGGGAAKEGSTCHRKKSARKIHCGTMGRRGRCKEGGMAGVLDELDHEKAKKKGPSYHVNACTLLRIPHKSKIGRARTEERKHDGMHLPVEKEHGLAPLQRQKDHRPNSTQWAQGPRGRVVTL